MLGNALGAYRIRRLLVTVPVTVWLFSCLLILTGFDLWTTGDGKLVGWVVLIGVTALFVVSIVWLLSVRVALYEQGIRYVSILGSKETRWAEVERFYYSAIKQTVWYGFIPIPTGTHYRFALIDSHGQKISFGAGIERGEELGKKLVEMTLEALTAKAAERFNSGVELDFGPIGMDKVSGLKVKGWFKFKEIPWDDVVDYSIDKGHFFVWRRGQKRTRGTPIQKIPNAFVLLALLDGIFSDPTQGR